MSHPLRAPAFRSVWGSGLVSDTGDWLLFIALPLVVLRLSGSAFGTSLAFLLELVPGAAATPLAAWCAEHLDPRRFLCTVAVAQGLALLPLLAVGALARVPALGVAYAVIVVEAVLTAASDPARNALLPRLVADEELVRANSLIGLAQNGARLVGGPLGGVVLAAGGLPAVVVADLASYLVAGTLIATVVVPHSRTESRDRTRASARAVLRLPTARRLLTITFGAQIAQGMFLVLFVLFVVHELHGGSGDVGLLRGVQAVGAVAGGLTLSLLARRVSPSALVGWSTVAFGVISLTIWNGPHVTVEIVPYVVLFALAGAPGVLLGTGLTSGLQLGVPPVLHGRAFALSGLVSYAGAAVGILAAGLLTGLLGLQMLLDGQALVYLAVGVLAVVAARGDSRTVVAARGDSRTVVAARATMPGAGEPSESTRSEGGAPVGFVG